MFRWLINLFKTDLPKVGEIWVSRKYKHRVVVLSVDNAWVEIKRLNEPRDITHNYLLDEFNDFFIEAD